jgi:putative tricarboxylic transport membrane protein
VSGEDGARGSSRQSFWGPRAFACAVLALGVVVLVGTFGLSAGGGYSPVGPGFFPLVVAGGLLLFGALLLVRTTITPDAYLGERVAAESEATHWPTVGLLLAVLVAYAYLLDPLGYVFATDLFFPAAAYVLGDTRVRYVVRNLIIGLVIGAVVFFGFTEALGVQVARRAVGPVPVR